MILLSNDMFDYIVRLLGWAVEGGTKVSQHPVVYLEFVWKSNPLQTCSMAEIYKELAQVWVPLMH